MKNKTAILDDVTAYVKRFVAFPEDHHSNLVSLWVAHTWLISEFDNTGRLGAFSAEPGSGKSRLMEVVSALSHRSVLSVSATPAAIFREIDKQAGELTLIFDEIDGVYSGKGEDNADLTTILNSGYYRNAYALRCVGDNHETRKFPTFAPVAMAGLSRAKIPDALMTRTFVIPMKKRAPGQAVEPYRRRLEQQNVEALSARLAELADDIRPGLAGYFPTMPDAVSDRAADIWEPLIAIADRVGGHWPQTARETCEKIVAQSSDSKPSLGIQLLWDIRTIFEQEGITEIATGDLIDHLAELEERPWADWYGAPISPRKLAEFLRQYDIRTQQFRSTIHGRIRGFRRPDFQDAFTRYLTTQTPSEGHPSEEAGHPGHAGRTPKSHGSAVSHVDSGPGTGPVTEQARDNSDVPDVTDVPEVPRGAPECPMHGADYLIGGCYSCDEIHGDHWAA
ncbi:DUF3631 domain-containing protein [Nesterenkonia marinintestina]|uniref:DUF3631 domain-containing protein n=1 Tax=Nesterenkonia marinintestina TaxID=2979865 RepID=UPI0021C12440|nr:DUF3631 domain-containing protein [Nesterenkonia sp. GX14115]